MAAKFRGLKMCKLSPAEKARIKADIQMAREHIKTLLARHKGD